MKISKKRLALLRKLESIIGNECYNGNIQNWGPNGIFYGSGREFRYPITFSCKDDGPIKRSGSYDDLPAEVQITGRYKFGSNELHIVAALDKVISYLEEHNDLKV
ncbi:hypothetical protein [Phyllobacterium sophorae]|uniref:Uncharacterized protein n=1 Tax=Phyllobacterium sophorae TaxID=1520277 RepID=A0A2P7B5L5_9HYPH|nr:hypothetical protein [Phyllobacterium sophorae]PSH61758.1 hypothetical protein CU103_20685 [Phyllobacterium sophorae]